MPGGHLCMSLLAVSIDRSQFPSQIKNDLLDSLRLRAVNHKFHYDSVEQTEKWLKLHETYSPARTDTDCLATYELAFAETARLLKQPRMDLISLGCGGGQKDATLIRQFRGRGIECRYFPCDVAIPMALTAHGAVQLEFPQLESRPAVCDLASMNDLKTFLVSLAGTNHSKLLAFFGMIPNFEPDVALGKLASALSDGDSCILSANLAPGPNYEEGVRRVLPLYDNDLTKEWLLTFLLHLGVERSDGWVIFEIERCPSGRDLRRITAYFTFERARRISVYGERFEFRAGERIRLFFSYRYTSERMDSLLREHGLTLEKSWITKSEEEGIFLCEKAKAN